VKCDEAYLIKCYRRWWIRYRTLKQMLQSPRESDEICFQGCY